MTPLLLPADARERHATLLALATLEVADAASALPRADQFLSAAQESSGLPPETESGAFGRLYLNRILDLDLAIDPDLEQRYRSHAARTAETLMDTAALPPGADRHLVLHNVATAYQHRYDRQPHPALFAAVISKRAQCWQCRIVAREVRALALHQLEAETLSRFDDRF